MALNYAPPTALIMQGIQYDREKAQEGVQTMDKMAELAALYSQLRNRRNLTELENEKLDLMRKQQFFNTGDISLLPPQEQSELASAGQPIQGPLGEGQTERQAYMPQSPVILQHLEFLKQYPFGRLGGASTPGEAVSSAKQPKPVIRTDPFTGEIVQVIASANPNEAPEVKVVIPSQGRSPIATTTKARVAMTEDQGLVDSVASEIDRVQVLNRNAYGGRTGAFAYGAKSALNLGTDDPKFRNTADVINTLRSQVARVLKSTFGGQLSDSERAYLNMVYGAAEEMSNVERDVAMTNVKTMLKNKLSASTAKYQTLSGTGQGGRGDPLGIR